MDEVYVIYDSVRKKYVSQIISIPHSDPLVLSIKFGDIYSAIVFDEYAIAIMEVERIYKSFRRDWPEKKMNLSVRRIYA